VSNVHYFYVTRQVPGAMGQKWSKFKKCFMVSFCNNFEGQISASWYNWWRC